MDILGLLEPQGQRSVPLCVTRPIKFVDTSVTSISAVDASEMFVVVLLAGLLVYVSVFCKVLDKLLFRLFALLGCGCDDDFAKLLLADVPLLLGVCLSNIGAATSVFGREFGFVVSAILEIH